MARQPARGLEEEPNNTEAVAFVEDLEPLRELWLLDFPWLSGNRGGGSGRGGGNEGGRIGRLRRYLILKHLLAIFRRER
jgi:hypothetical protein